MISSGRDIMGVTTMILDTANRYHYIDKNEIQWEYVYEKLGDDEGWWAWMTRPGGAEICIGRVSQEEIVERLKDNPPLTQDDYIDLELWIKSGGLDEYQPRKEN